MVMIIVGAVFARAVWRLVWFEERNDGPKPDSILRDVQGAYGWTLGEALPSGLVIVTNDFGDIIYNPMNTDISYLTLTDDRRIASVNVGLLHMQEDAAVQMLREKYGLRMTQRDSSQADSNYHAYFGTTNRQAVLRMTVLQEYGHTLNLEYRDEALCNLAERQTEIRRASEEKLKNNEIKRHL